MLKKSGRANKMKITMLETYKSVRKTWGTFKPTNRIKGDVKKEQSKKACRGKQKGE
jgi:hypothetical protein